MAGLHRLQSQLLNDGKITETEVDVIRDYIQQDGQLDLQDVKFLVGLLSEADEVCPEFDELFFPAFKEAVLEDGRIGQDEQFYLLKMLYSDGHIRQREKQFLQELRDEAREYPAEFEALCDEATAAHSTQWNVGGR